MVLFSVIHFKGEIAYVFVESHNLQKEGKIIIGTIIFGTNSLPPPHSVGGVVSLSPSFPVVS